MLEDKYFNCLFEKEPSLFEKEAIPIATQIRYFYVRMHKWIQKDTCWCVQNLDIDMLNEGKALLLLNSLPDSY